MFFTGLRSAEISAASTLGQPEVTQVGVLPPHCQSRGCAEASSQVSKPGQLKREKPLTGKHCSHRNCHLSYRKPSELMHLNLIPTVRLSDIKENVVQVERTKGYKQKASLTVPTQCSSGELSTFRNPSVQCNRQGKPHSALG